MIKPGFITRFFLNSGTTDHYKKLMEHHLAQSTYYQALLYHAWKCNRQQAKGLKRQAAKIKRLKQRINELENAN